MCPDNEIISNLLGRLRIMTKQVSKHLYNQATLFQKHYAIHLYLCINFVFNKTCSPFYFEYYTKLENWFLLGNWHILGAGNQLETVLIEFLSFKRATSHCVIYITRTRHNWKIKNIAHISDYHYCNWTHLLVCLVLVRYVPHSWRTSLCIGRTIKHRASSFQDHNNNHAINCFPFCNKGTPGSGSGLLQERNIKCLCLSRCSPKADLY